MVNTLNCDFDVDIDIQAHVDKTQFGVRAIQYNEREEIITNHVGVYINSNMPIDQSTGNAAIDYETAEKLGFIKIDLITNNSCNLFDSKEDLLNCINTEPNWDLFQDQNVVEKLPQIHRQFDIISSLNIKNINDLADAIALIRPGKIHLKDSYIKNKEKVRENLFRKPNNGLPYYKKSHAYAYATLIIAVLNKTTSNDLFEY